MSKIGNYVVGLEELTGEVMSLEHFESKRFFDMFLPINEVYSYDSTEHNIDCQVPSMGANHD